MRQLFTLALGLLLAQFSFSQTQVPQDKARVYLESKASDWGLAVADIREMSISNAYTSQHNGVQHVYFTQRYAGVPLYGIVNGVHLDRNNEVVFATNRFEPGIATRINTTEPTLTQEEAVMSALAALGMTDASRPVLKEKVGRTYTFYGHPNTHNDYTVKLMYQPVRETGEIILCWHMSLDLVGTADYWNVNIDAQTGAIVHQDNLTLYCSFGERQSTAHQHSENCVAEHDSAVAPLALANFLTGHGTYNVFALPTESPVHGDRELVSDPADPTASPFGWHDVNGEEGAEFTITRGNNVHAYLDLPNNNTSMGDEPEGGEDLVFDSYFDINDEPENMREADVTQLFYLCNRMHDISYAYGFDEAAGNFQEHNYSGASGDGDPVLAEAQDNSTSTTPEFNNANFSISPDGISGRMQTYLFTGTPGSPLTISAPEQIAGGYPAGTAIFAPLPAVPVVGEVVEAFDGSQNPSLGCEPIVNSDEVAGNIALIDRGICFFEEKTHLAEAAGAVAVIICDYLDEERFMDGIGGADPNIPAIRVSSSNCALIRASLAAGQTVTASIGIPESTGPLTVSSSFDNGIVAHEYGHGISTRLAGGPSVEACLFNDEQMGEGWSDFFALVTTHRAEDTADTPRGVGTYSERQHPDGRGVRRRPYTSDLAVNDTNMDDMIGTTRPHSVGEVLASAFWDLYWLMIDLYGYDPDLINGSGGNNRTIQLVMDGLKLQSCSPGFEDVRDAILQADVLNYDGQHACLIWDAFARRGVGFSANQGSVFDRNDNQMAFDVRPTCIQELKIVKTADRDLVDAGDPIEFQLTITNHKETPVTNVTVEDELPVGLSYQPGSATGASVEDLGNQLRFEIGTLLAGEEVTVTYTALTDIDNRSLTLFYDGLEDGDGNWDRDAPSGFDIWILSSSNPYTGSRSWFVLNSSDVNEQLLFLDEPVLVSGTNPTLRFYHDYNTQPAADGGYLQISADGGATWEDVPDAYIRNGYRGELLAETLFQPGIQAFWGNSSGYVASYVDLAAYQGQMIKVRFRWASNVEEGGVGWYVDDFEIMDKVAYEGEACVTSAEGDFACDQVDEGGVIVETNMTVSTDEVAGGPARWQVYPNPANDLLNIACNKALSGRLSVEIVGVNGRLLREWTEVSTNGQVMTLDTSDIPAGFYVVNIYSAEGVFTEKVTIL